MIVPGFDAPETVLKFETPMITEVGADSSIVMDHVDSQCA
jgi:hypothetical protein